MSTASRPSSSVDVLAYMREVGRRARAAARLLARAETAAKDAALLAMAAEIECQASILIAANRKDIDVGKQQGLDAAMLDRLELNVAFSPWRMVCAKLPSFPIQSARSPA